MQWRRRRTAANACAVVTIVICFLDTPREVRAGDAHEPLQLEVFINGAPVNLIGSFVKFPNDRIAAEPSELEEIGIAVPASKSGAKLIALDEIPSVTYRYDQPLQRISIAMENSRRKQRAYDVRGKSSTLDTPVRSAFGTVINYNLLSSTSNFKATQPFTFTGSALTLDARMFSPYGVLNQSSIVRSSFNQNAEYLRLDSSYRFSDPQSLMTYRAGDAITGGLAWTRPIRIGGFQAQRSFSLRPDLVTTPLASLGGTAAVPSTVDLYINNIRTFSENVGPGPFSLTNVPVVSGAGNARIVIRDAAGHETTSNIPFYASPNLLAPGLTSFSVEAGVPRLSYGASNDNYLDTPVASATLRKGIFDDLTVEAHVEGQNGLANGGVGATFATGAFGVASVALSGSHLSDALGLQSYVGFETSLFGIQISLSSQRVFGDYNDLASTTARLQNSAAGLQGSQYGLLGIIAPASPNSFAVVSTNKLQRSLERITFGIPLPSDTKSNLSASYIRMRDDIRGATDVVTGTWSKALPYNASIFASAFSSFGTNNSMGIFAGFSIAFENGVSTSSSVSSSPAGATVSADAIKPIGMKDGSYGWRVRDSEGATPYREASVVYRSSIGRIQVGALQNREDSRGVVEVDGAVVAMGGGVFASNRVDDAFAVVKTGIPDMPVLQDNREIGKTDSNGRFLVPTLRSYQGNKIAIDPTALPVDVSIESTREIIKPADRSGVIVDFQVKAEHSAAVVVLTRPTGDFVAAGSTVRTEGGEEFIVGYDGRVYLKGLSTLNNVQVSGGGVQCSAQFPFSPRSGEQILISPVICK